MSDIEIDLDTNLPKLPWPKHFWRVAQRYNPYGELVPAIELRRKRLVGSVLVEYVYTGGTAPDTILWKAKKVFASVESNFKRAQDLAAVLGDYPPKRLGK